MKVEIGIVHAYSLEEFKRFNVIFKEVEQIDERFVNKALLHSLNFDREYERLFYRIEIRYAEINHMEEDAYKIYGFGYAFSDKLIVKIKFNFDINDFYKNTVEIEKRFEEV